MKNKAIENILNKLWHGYYGLEDAIDDVEEYIIELEEHIDELKLKIEDQESIIKALT